MMEMEASAQREEEVNPPPAATNGASPSDATFIPLEGQGVASSEPVALPEALQGADEQATVVVPSPVEPTIVPAAESVPVEAAAPAVEIVPLLPDEAAAPLPVRPVAATPSESQTAVSDEAAQLIPAGGDEASDEALPLARRGRIELLPNEEIIYHLGALYLTNKRVLLYAPTVLRSAFLRDVDAMGLATERLSSGVFILGVVMMVAAGLTGTLIFFDARQELAADSPLKSALSNVRDVLPLPLEWLAIAVAALGLFFIVSYSLYISKSLFVSVHGRPLITVSISGYRPRNLDEVDNFINALAAAKDGVIEARSE